MQAEEREDNKVNYEHDYNLVIKKVFKCYNLYVKENCKII